VSLTGAGDCLVGGTLASICSGLDVMVLQIIAGSYHLIKAVTSDFSDFCLVQTMQGPYIRLPKFCFMNQCFSP
jgi:fructose-1-phosphate kinase PfkB-like protein